MLLLFSWVERGAKVPLDCAGINEEATSASAATSPFIVRVGAHVRARACVPPPPSGLGPSLLKGVQTRSLPLCEDVPVFSIHSVSARVDR